MAAAAPTADMTKTTTSPPESLWQQACKAEGVGFVHKTSQLYPKVKARYDELTRVRDAAQPELRLRRACNSYASADGSTYIQYEAFPDEYRLANSIFQQLPHMNADQIRYSNSILERAKDLYKCDKPDNSFEVVNSKRLAFEEAFSLNVTSTH